MKVHFSTGKRGLDLNSIHREVVAGNSDRNVTIRLSHTHYGKRLTLSGDARNLLTSATLHDIDHRVKEGQLTFCPEMCSPQHFTAIEHSWRTSWVDIFKAMTVDKKCDYVTFLVMNKIIMIDLSWQYASHSHIGHKLAAYIYEWLSETVSTAYRDWIIRRAISLNYDPLPVNLDRGLTYTEWSTYCLTPEERAKSSFADYAAYLVLTGQMSVCSEGVRLRYTHTTPKLIADGFQAISVLTSDNLEQLKQLYEESAPKHLHNPVKPLVLALKEIKAKT